MKKDALHPLDYWLLDKDLSLPAFAREHGLPLRALYDLVDHERKVVPKLTTLLTVEKATKKAVTVQKMSDWFKVKA